MPASSRITLDVGPLLEEAWTGIPVFTKRLAESLLSEPDVDVEFSFNLTRLPTLFVTDVLKHGSGSFLRTEFEHAANSFGLSIIDHSRPLLFPSVKTSFGVSVAEASVVHDISTLLMPETHERANVDHHLRDFSLELSSNARTFCVSEATQAALELAYPSVKGKTDVVYQYVDWPDDFGEINRHLPGIGFQPYALVIATLEPRKNLSLLFKALEQPALRQSDMRFVIVGKSGWRLSEALAALDTCDRGRISFAGFTSEFVKYRLLRHAEFLIFPSQYEGFGIPALEAMSLGKPVLASISSSLPEVIGDGGVYFDPFSSEDFARGFLEIVDADRNSRLARSALAAASRFDRTTMLAPILNWLRGLS